MRIREKLRVATVTVLAAAAAGALAALIVRDQVTRHQRNLFSDRSLRRLAALGHMSREPASVDNIRVLRDFIAWEPKKLLRERARAIVARMEAEAGEADVAAGSEVV